MSNSARHRKISRLIPQGQKKEHARSLTARYWARQRMGRAAEEMLAQMEEDDAEMVDAPDPVLPAEPTRWERFKDHRSRWGKRA